MGHVFEQLVKTDAARYTSLITSLSKDISDFTAPNMTTLVEYVQDTRARLGVIMADETAVLAEFPTWPQVLCCCMHAGTCNWWQLPNLEPLIFRVVWLACIQIPKYTEVRWDDVCVKHAHFAAGEVAVPV